jgi:hypothetical protein
MGKPYSTTESDKKIDGKAILLHERDDVATALKRLEAGEQVAVSLGSRRDEVRLKEGIDFGHKLALRTIEKGEEILKYGLPIGRALARIEPGEWVHVHNCRSEHFSLYHQSVISNHSLGTAARS